MKIYRAMGAMPYVIAGFVRKRKLSLPVGSGSRLIVQLPVERLLIKTAQSY
ncbi:hypothetical protein RM533_04700 [Croceicoccus sp. F390]|uniref:Uncharacterized protein n=1 Tax=Croceicoccus esteveae TaxID=3075597 RepID=A0ABU2ZGH5_9SPHN|nr:hypothetical protein [Croceicoccus sp. F390]MDT0575476.1 hypothetical protein [Croceicoccus sp. F390]